MLCTDIGMLSLCRGAEVSGEDIPLDPRDWTRQDVSTWLSLLALKHHDLNTHPERFPMNGKGLVLLTRDMFCDRVPDPVGQGAGSEGTPGGFLIHDELQLRLQRAIGEQMRRIQDMDSLIRAGLITH